MDRYRSFADLAAGETLGTDYRIVAKDRNSAVVVLAPHGGGIEPTTSEIAAAIAGDAYSLYCFEGVDQNRPHGDLHITSERFDEPRGRAIVAAATYAVAVHGRADADDSETTWLGGLDDDLVGLALARLASVGFNGLTGHHELAGRATRNICNGTRSGMGLQLEIPRGLRDRLRNGPDLMRSYAEAVRSAVARRME